MQDFSRICAAFGLIALGIAATPGCESNNQCVTPQGCGPEQLCVAHECVGTEVEGDRWALYLEEFRVRLDADCGVCHFAGANDADVETDDGSWRLHSGASLSLAQIEDSYLDVQDFLAPGDPQLSPLVAYGRGLINVEFDAGGTIQPHPAIWGSKENLGYVRVLNWLAQFPDATPPADPPPDPPMVADPGGGLDGYQEGVHDLLAFTCAGCHGLGGPQAWQIAPSMAAPDAVLASYEATIRFVTPGDPEGSDLLKWARAELGAHPPIWTAADAGHVAVGEWIRKSTP